MDVSNHKKRTTPLFRWIVFNCMHFLKGRFDNKIKNKQIYWYQFKQTEELEEEEKSQDYEILATASNTISFPILGYSISFYAFCFIQYILCF
jgi:hypothetical protein